MHEIVDGYSWRVVVFLSWRSLSPHSLSLPKKHNKTIIVELVNSRYWGGGDPYLDLDGSKCTVSSNPVIKFVYPIEIVCFRGFFVQLWVMYLCSCIGIISSVIEMMWEYLDDAISLLCSFLSQLGPCPSKWWPLSRRRSAPSTHLTSPRCVHV